MRLARGHLALETRGQELGVAPALAPRLREQAIGRGQQRWGLERATQVHEILGRRRHQGAPSTWS
jgi:hypothetical protein